MKQKTTSKNELTGFAFFILIAFFTLFAKTPTAPAFSNRLFSDLLAGKAPFNPVGSQFAIFKPFLPSHEKVAFIMDFPFSPYLLQIDQLYSAQSYLTPSILTYETNARAALVYCSNTPIAKRRMEETGYRILLPLAEGKGIAVKK